MNDKSTSTKMEILEDIANDPPSTSIKAEMHENIVIKEPVAAIDTTDKKGQNYNTRQANSFAAKKTVAQGMMDVALITANANQLRYLIEYQRNSPMFYLIMILIIISLLLQD
ncbi:PREDICTED: ninjurin-1-like isoform X2 [Wasmannia auropunctata]|uniref:ninjurin-1-like isoform X2 n=1 Tax=Wasmannia auropunctata TaxID=64793 RepID=UPI0005EEF86D|nr:PREDICTED: ninjurin-1-like isoform X2 [Wasmannia auropunctata]